MSADDDKYPTESGRRRFVKGVVGSAALGSVATGTAATIETVTSAAGAGGGITEYIAIKNVGGPAPRGMPMIPIEITSAGEIKGVWPEVKTRKVQGREVKVAESDIGGTTYSSTWFQYCGVQTYAGIKPDADQDTFFRTTSGPYSWENEIEGGTKLTVDMFDRYKSWTNFTDKKLGQPAIASWRSNGDAQTIPVQVLRSPEVSKIANGEGEYSSIPGNVRSFFDAATDQNVMAWLDKCTHFCCVPGFKAYADSKKFGAADKIYCQCHQSRYDPFQPVKKTFTALPRPDE